MRRSTSVPRPSGIAAVLVAAIICSCSSLPSGPANTFAREVVKDSIRYTAFQEGPRPGAPVIGGIRLTNESSDTVQITAPGGCPVRLFLYSTSRNEPALWDSARSEDLCVLSELRVILAPLKSFQFYAAPRAAELQAHIPPGTYRLALQLHVEGNPGPLDAGSVTIKY